MPPPDVDLSQVADSCRFVGSPYHKDTRTYSSELPAIGDRTLASVPAIFPHRELAEGWLKEAVRAGQIGAWERGYPRYVRYREGDAVYEARQGAPGSGEYHGYPLEPSQRVRGL